MKVVNETVPNREIAEFIHAHENLFLKLKKSELHTDEENYYKVSSSKYYLGKERTVLLN